MGSWGPGKATVPHPSDWELFLYYRPGLGLVTPLAPVPVRHSQGCGAGPLFPYPRWPDTQGGKPERRVASDLSRSGEGFPR